ncbi:serine/threonine-protein kinase [Nocardiopsis sp. N85]|uniref:serine/threonine-protein kinase n=1 Tax=Nocardiopsis sp. N85 TaxID=3029400 RepID=UPI00237F28AA|nr:serine/threonine-protein kinase [Nocardiopsis sp. N85]MDE3719899.1 serine/threonine-protein kinase [Nocardiopsis sp. N85]
MASTVVLPPHIRPLLPEDPPWVGAHRLIGRLGASGLGVVHAAVTPEGHALALKIMNEEWVSAAAPDAALDPRRLRGEYGLGVLDGGVHRNRPWAAVEYLPALDLGVHAGVRGPFGGQTLLVLAAGIAEALTAVHAGRVPHGDVKPGNVLVTAAGPRLVDFGLARQVDDGDSHTTIGSPGWLAPERYAGKRPDEASDVFSWACTVLFAATGLPPFGTIASQSEAVARTNAGVDLSVIPPGPARILARALDRDPARRPSAEEIHLECLLLLGVSEDTPRDAWGDRLHGFVRSHWPYVDVAWHRPERWAQAARGLDAEAAASGRRTWTPAKVENARRLVSTRDPITGELKMVPAPGSDAPASTAATGDGHDARDHEVRSGPDDRDTDRESEGTGAEGGRADRRRRERRGGGAGRLLAVGAACCFALAVAGGGGYVLFDALAQDAEPVSETPGTDANDPQETASPTGIDLVAASLDRLTAARTLEMTILTHAGNGEGYGQPLPGNTAASPTLFDRVLYQADPEAVRWTSTVSGARAADLMLVDGELLYSGTTAWNGPAVWAPAAATDLGASEAVFDPERILEPLARVVETGTVTSEEETVFAAPGPVEDAYGHLAGEDPPDEVPAVLIEGTFLPETASEEAGFTLVATEDGVPLAFATEGEPQGGYVLNGRPIAQRLPAAFTEPVPAPEYWYTRYTFVGVDGDLDVGVPEPEDVQRAVRPTGE